METPCGINDPFYGSPCQMEMGLCVNPACGMRSEFNWSSMMHELYGLHYARYLVTIPIPEERG